jgi:hypothetical protein
MSKEDITQEGKRGIAAGKAVGESLRDKNAPMKRQRLADRQPSKKMGGGMMRRYSSGAMAEDRAMEGRKAAYKKMGFEAMMKSGEIKFPGQNKKRTRENPMKEERFQRTRQSQIAKVVGKENVSDPRKVERKMVGGMAKKYNKGGGADTGTAGETKSRRAVASDRLKRRLNTAIERRRRLGRELGPIGGFGGIPSPKRTPGAGPKGLIPERLSRQDIVFTTDKSFLKDMKPPSGAAPGKFKSGTMVKARGCKLGRTRPTKIT